MGEDRIQLTEEQLAGVTGGTLLPDGRVSYCGHEFSLSTEEDYEKVLTEFGPDFGISVGGNDAEQKLWEKYYNWYYRKFGYSHGADNR